MKSQQEKEAPLSSLSLRETPSPLPLSLPSPLFSPPSFPSPLPQTHKATQLTRPTDRPPLDKQSSSTLLLYPKFDVRGSRSSTARGAQKTESCLEPFGPSLFFERRPKTKSPSAMENIS